MTFEYHVSVTGSDDADGSPAAPLATINRAAALAAPGDRVVVHAGEYREWVKPVRGGRSDQRRITYQGAPGEHVAIKGSERVTGWEQVDEAGTVWLARVPNALFGDWNPFAIEVDGDWIHYPEPDSPRVHLGDVYLNGRSFYEAASRAAVDDPPRRTSVLDRWTERMVPTHEPDQSVYVWYAQVGAEETTIWANFHGADPNVEIVEINVRRSVFSPAEHHVNYITVRGFELAHAATPWAPPTADQPGLIGPNWAKGWIIEDNVIHDSKCVGVSIGKEASTGHNFAATRGDKPGYQYQLESVFAARQIGWDREHIGSHVIRGNTIYNCGQAGIVGHLGCVFSTIADNHIYDIALKREFYGYEIAGIKLHAAIDVTIAHNHIHDCSLGLWLDWQTQGTRIARNLFHANNRDVFVEVSHGPYLADHNVFASPASLELFSQGGAFVHNLVCGTVRLEPVMDRATPYHVPHSTQVAGYAFIAGGDDRWVGNLFLGGDMRDAYANPGELTESTLAYGTAGYDGYPASGEEFLHLVCSGVGDHRKFYGVKQPVYARDNVYAGGARAFAGEQGALVVSPDERVHVAVVPDFSGAPASPRTERSEGTPGSPRVRAARNERADSWGGNSWGGDSWGGGRDAVFLDIDLPPAVAGFTTRVIGGADLPPARYPDAEFENPDGTPATMDVDLTGVHKYPDRAYPPGPLAELPAGLATDAGRIRIW